MKKILAFALCLCILGSLAMPAFATADAADALLTVTELAPVTAIMEEEIPTVEETPAVEETPVVEETPAEAEAPVEEETPVEEEAPVEEETPAEEEAPAEEETPVEEETPAMDGSTSGSCGNGVTWAYDETTKTLTISGDGPMPDYEKPDDTPWREYYDECTTIVFGSNITAIGSYAFADFVVEELTIPGSVNRIGQGAFRNCTKLTELTLPEGVKTMEGESFSGCSGLTTVYLPLSLMDYGDSEFFAFVGCDAITDVYYPGLESTFLAKLGANYFGEGATIHYEDTLNLPLSGDVNETITWKLDENHVLTITGTGAMPDYEHSSYAPWGDYRAEILKIVIGEGITHVGNCSFSWCSNVTSTTLPDGLLSIGEEAFSVGGCGDTINFPEGLKTIGKEAFHMNTLTEVILPESVTFVGDGAFAMGDIATLYLPGSCTAEDVAFGVFSNNPIKILGLGTGTTSIPACLAHLTTLTQLELPPLFEMLSGDFIMQNEDLEIVVVGTEPYEGIEFVEWMDDDSNFYTNEELLTADVSGKTLYATYQYIWRDPGPFEDVGEDDWFYEYVKYCYQNGIMNGTSEDTFDPYYGATRAEVVTVLYRMAGEPEVTAGTSFGDVPAGEWFAGAVAWAAEEGIAKGYGDGTFKPYSLVTREEFLVFLNRFAGYLDMNLNTWSKLYDLRNYADAQYVSSWAQEAEVWSVIMGLQTGIEVGDATYLYPGDSILRSELATFLCRFMDNVYAILEVEVFQSCVGKSPDTLTELFGAPIQKSVFVPQSSYETYKISDLRGCDGDGCSTAIWYFDGFGFYIHKDADGTQIVSGWGRTK